MLNVLLSIIVLVLMFIFATVTFILANIDRIFKEVLDMDKNIIKVKPNKEGKIFITLYGTKYQIVIEEEKPATKPAKAEK